MGTKLFVSVCALAIIGGSYWAFARGTAPQLTSQMGDTNSGENAKPGGIHGLSVEPAAAAARKDLAAKLNIDDRNIVIMLVENRTWSDGCLGLGLPHESCLAALVEGFRVELLAKEKTYVYRTDIAGNSLRSESVE